MNAQETSAVLGILSAAWPNQKVSEQTARVWMDILSDIDPEDAMAAARALVKRSEWFPSIAQFRNEAEARAHARRNKLASDRGLPGRGHKPAFPPPQLLEAARTLLAELGRAKHWHGGPRPCPVCGGLREPQRTDRSPSSSHRTLRLIEEQ